MVDTHQHSSHPRISARLKRANGHLNSVIAMIAEGRPCSEIAQQLHAVEKAITNAKRELIFDHIDHCLDQDPDAQDSAATTAEFRDIARYL
ncbi:Copper-sensitive operon repressor [Phaeobacter sp. CECT 5382]|uniref:metal-sensing transcriptional repressor n=1 Tax=Phaeobacter sp. CECT 5382 TaxID=1712645 RepID=UPI0006DBB383|nr:metal-sensing transcriptional repressor [Phaeobacter sp. CECT 5382]CUH89092.1 Copper-sensitive operon repressor [Phaeobacter sp. CECT 5382]